NPKATHTASVLILLLEQLAKGCFDTTWIRTMLPVSAVRRADESARSCAGIHRDSTPAGTLRGCLRCRIQQCCRNQESDRRVISTLPRIRSAKWLVLIWKDR